MIVATKTKKKNVRIGILSLLVIKTHEVRPTV